DDLGVPEGLIAGRALGHLVTALAEPARPGSGSVVLQAHQRRGGGLADRGAGGRLAAGPPPRGGRGGARPPAPPPPPDRAAVRAASPSASSRTMSWSRTCGWASAPMVPSTESSWPDGPVTISGDSVCGGRRPGP